MDNQEYLDSKFDNQYLKSVVFELKFPSMLSILDQISQVQELFRDDLPDVEEIFPFPSNLFPSNADSKLMKTISFLSSDKNIRLNLAHDTISLLVFDYRTIESFRDRVEQFFNPLFNMFQINTLVRSGLRYIMSYPFETSSDDAISSEFKQNFVPLWNENVVSIQDLLLQGCEIRKKLNNDIVITLRSRFNRAEVVIYDLDFDVYTTQPHNCNEYLALLQTLRTEEKSHFLHSVSKDFLTKLGASPME